jgi:hypothetical protein
MQKPFIFLDSGPLIETSSLMADGSDLSPLFELFSSAHEKFDLGSK